MAAKNDSGIINFILSIGFIFIIIIFLISIIGISRYVFSDNTVIKEHVISTKNLLDKIDEVEKSTKDSNNETLFEKKEENFLDLNSNNFNINDISFLNVNENKSWVTLQFDSQIYNSENTYYAKIKNINNLKKGNKLIYKDHDNITNTGTFLSIEENSISILNDYNEKIDTINENNIIGRIFFIKNN